MEGQGLLRRPLSEVTGHTHPPLLGPQPANLPVWRARSSTICCSSPLPSLLSVLGRRSGESLGQDGDLTKLSEGPEGGSGHQQRAESLAVGESNRQYME